MESLYEDLYGDVKNLLKNTKRRMGVKDAEMTKSDNDDETFTTDSNFNNGKMYIDEEFCNKLISYLEQEMDKSFPGHTKLKSVLTHEVRKVMKKGDDKELKRVVEKIRDIILKEKIKFMDNIEKRVSKVLVGKKY
jgi:hypothetical protein